jgi:hypothetical protein
MRDLEIYIRTFTGRLYHANKLKENCIKFISPNVKLINTKSAESTYNEKFIFGMHNALISSNHQYVLVLEDDMVFSEQAKESLQAAIKKELPLLWYSIPSKRVIEHSKKISTDIYILPSFDGLHYSGAILIKRDILKCYISHYLAAHLTYKCRNYDVTFSYFIRETLGSLFMQPGIFASNPQVESAVSTTKVSDHHRIEDHSQIDPYFDFEKVLNDWY